MREVYQTAQRAPTEVARRTTLEDGSSSPPGFGVGTGMFADGAAPSRGTLKLWNPRDTLDARHAEPR
jgi:hypothetical protein